MIFILLSIFCNVLLLVILKSFDQFKIPAIQGIVVNYFVAATVSFFFIPEHIFIKDIVSAPWLSLSLPLGLLFIAIFYLISLTAQKIGISVASVASKMSMVIPIIIAIYLYSESCNAVKIIGVILSLLAVYLTVKKEKKNTETSTAQKKQTKMVLLPILVFFGTGIIDAIVNNSKKLYLPSHSDTAKFIAVSFYVAGIVGAILITVQILRGKMKMKWQSLIGGIILGIPNYFSIYFVMLAINESGFESSVIYPIVNMGVVLISSLCGILFFKEKLSKINYAGIALSILAIAMITGLLN